MMSMYKIAVLGDRDSVIGFKAVGLDVFPCEPDEGLAKQFNALVREGYSIIYIVERYALLLEEEIKKYKDLASPAVILIPGKDGSLGLGLDALQSSVERAVGADIL